MLRRILRKLLRPRAPRVRQGKPKPYARILEATADQKSVPPRDIREGGRACKEYTVGLPAGYPAREIVIRLSVPRLPHWHPYEFTEHVIDAAGRPTNTVVAGTIGGFSISDDLGANWRHVRVREYSGRRFVHVKALDGGEFIAQAEPLRELGDRPFAVDVLAVDSAGRILGTHHNLSVPWHGCRAVDFAGGVAMYAEYPPNAGRENRLPSRVFRSRDRGRTWQIVFERSGEEQRHFHFLQARPGVPGEWWLTAGDAPEECRIWVTKDDGDTWRDITVIGRGKIVCGDEKFSRDLFRLTDLVWEGDDVIWGTDDLLWDVKNGLPGARMFRSAIGEPLAPQFVAQGKWHVRSFVDVGDFYVVLSQGCPEPRAVASPDARPGVYLMPKRAIPGAPGAVHLFDIDIYSSRRTGFTYARASRAAKDGTFFTYRARTDAFSGGHQILRWDVRLS